jgi:hypothetical protein
MSDALNALEGLYVFLTTNLSVLQSTYPAEPQKSELMSLYVTARTNYWKCIDATFHDDDPQVASLVSQMKTQQTAITAEVAALTDVAKILNDITTAVQIGAKLVAFAA